MQPGPIRRNRRPIRLPHYDYASAGLYFVTICSHQRRPLFGEIKDQKMHLNAVGKIVESEWLKTARLRENVTLDVFIVMPNHFHVIVILTESPQFWGQQDERPKRQFAQPLPHSLPTIVGAFKSAVTRCTRKTLQAPGAPVWQRGYFEHVIRSEKTYRQIRDYIINNPVLWRDDRYFIK
ncbi:MAG: hypothetical protein H6695_10995 [Deferribacteres bacterium]|nr:hypothetical protein [Deferribacteres bacterium]